VLLAPQRSVAHGDQRMKPAAELEYCPPFIDNERVLSGTIESRLSIGHNVAKHRYFSLQKRFV
jgi:hypothetical protein